MSKIVLGLSGGVDSAVAARLLRRAGHEVLGLYLDIGDAAARADAVSTAEFLNIDLTVLDISAELERHVCAPFTESYLRGETPNPCVMCNPAVKFKSLLDFAAARGADFIATGHYARAENGALYKGRPANDQSYMLCRLTREQAARLVLPLGALEKTETRALAGEFQLPVASKSDSMEICFIPDRDYAGYISRRAALPGPGGFTLHGEPIARHEGIHRWTVGQRIPGLYNGRKLYVSRIIPERNEIELALWEELFKNTVRARDMSWLIEAPRSPLRASVKVRHTKWECPGCTVTPLPDGGAEIVTDEPLRAPAPGQAAALYQGERLIGGGFIINSP
ncbi:MAG: tRNA 2-thiouridine(34) synthase MnmA [Butyricicoccus sp.]|nr:tRNA 2-thiouridine(34) synthase MnmA [Butyricicoccus sp.]